MKILLSALVLLLLSGPGYAQLKVDDIAITADSSEFDNKEKKIILDGNVQIVFRGNYIAADKATIHRGDKKVFAEGNITYKNANLYAEASKLEYNYETDMGTFVDGFVQSGQVVFEGSLVEQVGKNEFIATNAKYTACETCPPAWSFTGSKIKAELGGYADISYPVLRVADIPIFVLPRILVPLKSDRQSGFLVPTIGFANRSGFTIASHYFWAMARNKDLTYSLKSYENRGFKNSIEYRYVMDKNSNGKLLAGFLKDRAFRNALDDSTETAQTVDRGFLNYEHFFKLPDNYIQRAQIRYISDLRYMRDFSDEITEHGKSSLENKLSLSKSFDRQNLNAEIAFNVNLLKSDAFADNSDAVHRFPDIRYSITDRRIFNSNFLFRLDSRYVRFSRNTFSYDDICQAGACDDGGGTDEVRRVDTKRDGQFDPGTDLIRTGDRFEIRPQISYPIQIGKSLNILPTIVASETQYKFDPISTGYSRSAARRYIQTDLDVKTLFSRVYQSDSKMDPEHPTYLKHEVEPQITYSNRPWLRRADHEFFGNFSSKPFSRSQEKVTDTDLFGTDKIQFDYEDRLFDKELVEFTIENRIIRKRFESGQYVYKNIASAKLSQAFDFVESRNPTPKPWTTIDLDLFLGMDNVELYSTASYYPYTNVTNNSSRVRFLDQFKNYFEMTYNQSFTINDDDSFEFSKRTEVWGTGVGYKGSWFTLNGGLNYSAVNFRVQSWGYSALFTPPGDCWNIEFVHKQDIGSDVNYKINFNFDFGGNNQG